MSKDGRESWRTLSDKEPIETMPEIIKRATSKTLSYGADIQNSFIIVLPIDIDISKNINDITRAADVSPSFTEKYLVHMQHTPNPFDPLMALAIKSPIQVFNANGVEPIKIPMYGMRNIIKYIMTETLD